MWFFIPFLWPQFPPRRDFGKSPLVCFKWGPFAVFSCFHPPNIPPVGAGGKRICIFKLFDLLPLRLFFLSRCLVGFFPRCPVFLSSFFLPRTIAGPLPLTLCLSWSPPLAVKNGGNFPYWPVFFFTLYNQGRPFFPPRESFLLSWVSGRSAPCGPQWSSSPVVYSPLSLFCSRLPT